MKFIIFLGVIFSSFVSAELKEPIKLDLGGSYSGVIYKDGSGSYGKKGDEDRWDILIQFDQITDEPTVWLNRRPYRTFSHMGKTHKVQTKDGISLVIKFEGESEEACVSGHNNYSKKAVFRVDKGEPVYTLKTGCTFLNGFNFTSMSNVNLDEQLRRGNKVAIRGYSYRGQHNATIDLAGYTKISKYLRQKFLDLRYEQMTRAKH